MPETPRSLGYRMPAEWEPHAATWLAWPHNRQDWPGKFAPIAWVYCEIVRKLARVERVRILVENEDLEQDARRKLKKAGANLDAVEFFRCPTDRVWTRDYCPLFVQGLRREVAITNWRFNGWAKYDNWKRDNAVPPVLAKRLKMRQWKPEVVLEGGSIDVNGAGLALSTEECLLSPVQARNPALSREQIEQALSEYLSIDKVVWLGRGIAGDDTHGHIDDLARFVGPGPVVTVVEDDPADANYAPLEGYSRRLRGAADQDEQPPELEVLPMPAAPCFADHRLPAGERHGHRHESERQHVQQ